MRRFWERVVLRKSLGYLVLGAILIIAVVVLGRELDHRFAGFEAWIERISPWGMIVFIALVVVLTSLFVPDSVLAFTAGALFGLGGGTLVILAAAPVAASAQYLVAHHLLRDRIERTMNAKPSLLAIQQAVRSQELRLQVLLRLTPLNPAVTSYLLGAAGVRFGGFLLACLALAPGLFVEVYFGHAGRHVVRMAAGDDRTVLMHDAVLIGGLVACVLVMVALSGLARKAVQAAVTDVAAR